MTRRVEGDETKAETAPYIFGPIRFISFDKTDSGFMAKVSFRVVEGIQANSERFIHADNLEDLAKKLSDILIREGIE